MLFECCCSAGIVQKILGKATTNKEAKPQSKYKRTSSRRILPVRGNAQIEDEYDVNQKVLGSGAFGQVKLATRKCSGLPRVAKFMLKSAIPDQAALIDELLIQCDLDHPNICRIFDFFETSSEIQLVMEFCEGGDLCDAMFHATSFSETDAHHFFKQVLEAVNYMHNMRIAHRDLKPENFLLKSKGCEFVANQIKVVDFGFARKFNPDNCNMTTKCGTPSFLAPEIFDEQPYSENCDLWSCGVILYLFLSGDVPFQGEELKDIFANARAGPPNFEGEEWNGITPTAKLAVVQMLHLDPLRRFSADRLLHESPWILREFGNQGVDEEVQKVRSGVIVQRMRNFQKWGELKKVGAHLVAHSLPDGEKQDLRKTFKAMDKNSDGILSREELRQGLGDRIPGCEFETIFMSADTDGSGSVDWTEFLAALATAKQLSCRSACEEAFRVLDSNGDDKLCVQEIAELLNRDRPEDKLVLEELSQVDSDGDGFIDIDEFVKLMSEVVFNKSDSDLPSGSPTKAMSLQPRNKTVSTMKFASS